KKIAVGGGALDVADAPNPRGGSWGTDDTIVYTPAFPSGVSRISANGVTLTPVTTLDSKNPVHRHNWPEFLPGAKAILFSENTTGDWEEADIVVQSLETGERRVLVHGGSYARYVSPGYIVYARASNLLAVPFDLSRLEVTGEVLPIIEGVQHDLGRGGAQF